MSYIANRYPGRGYIVANFPSSTPGNQGATPMFANTQGTQKWHPTVVYLLALVFAEIFLLAILRSLPILKG